jgi:hypothetical protein
MAGKKQDPRRNGRAGSVTAKTANRGGWVADPGEAAQSHSLSPRLLGAKEAYDKLVAALRTDAEETPEAGFYTTDELAKAIGQVGRSIHHMIARAMSADPPLIERRMYRIKSGPYIRSMPHYRIIK